MMCDTWLIHGIHGFRTRQESCDAKTCAEALPVTVAGIGRDVGPVGCEGARARVWKTIIIGNYPTAIALRDALAQDDILIGDLAAQMLRLPTFTLTSTRAKIDLSLVAARQLGFRSSRASFAEVYAHAAEVGLDLCPSEVGPQLRLQYLDQKVGEYLIIGMKPLPTASGSDACFVVGNGGAGLLIIGRSAASDLTVASRSRFVFSSRR
jgi:hypothetical protein